MTNTTNTITMKNGTEYTIVNYFDVWGNAQDGYEVNESCTESDVLFISDDEMNVEEKIITMLQELNYLTTDAILDETIECHYTGDWYEIEMMNGCPLFSIRPIEFSDEGLRV